MEMTPHSMRMLWIKTLNAIICSQLICRGSMNLPSSRMNRKTHPKFVHPGELDEHDIESVQVCQLEMLSRRVRILTLYEETHSISLAQISIFSKSPLSLLPMLS